MKKTCNIGEGFKSFVSTYCCSKCGNSLAMAKPAQKPLLAGGAPNAQHVTFARPAYDYGDLDLPQPEEHRPPQKQNSAKNKAFRTHSVTNRLLKNRNLKTREIVDRAGTRIEARQKENLRQTLSGPPVNLVKLLKRNKRIDNRAKDTPKVIKVKLTKK